MEYHTTIEINSCNKSIILKPALYKDIPVWEIYLDDRCYILRKNQNGWCQSSDTALSEEELERIGDAIEYIQIKNAS